MITVYWWNFGKKTLDYKGSYEGFFKERGIKAIKISNNNYNFKINTANTSTILKSYGSERECYNEAIKLFLTLLGDKSVLIDENGIDFKVNW